MFLAYIDEDPCFSLAEVFHPESSSEGARVVAQEMRGLLCSPPNKIFGTGNLRKVQSCSSMNIKGIKAMVSLSTFEYQYALVSLQLPFSMLT